MMAVPHATRPARAACFITAHALPCATALLLALLCALQAWALWRAPPAWYPSALTLTLAPGQDLTLGRLELAAPQADSRHLSVRRTVTGAWMLRNLSAARQVVLQREDGDQRMGSVPLRTGQRFQLDDKVFDVLAAGGGEVTLARDGHQWRYDGALLYRDGRPQAPCPEARLAGRLLAHWNRWLPSSLSIARPLSLGGNLQCGNRLGLEGVTPGAALLARANGQLQLIAASPDGEHPPLSLLAADTETDLRQQELPLAGVRAIIVGHTRLQLDANGEQLTMIPSRHIALRGAPELRLPPQLQWRWEPRALRPDLNGGADRAIMAGSLLCLGGMLLSVPWRPARARWRERCAMLAPGALLLAGVAGLLLQRTGHVPGAACSLLLGATALCGWLALPGRLSLHGAAGLILLAAGLLAQMELGLGADESSWLRYYQKSAAMLAIGVSLGGAWRMWARCPHYPMGQRTVEWGLFSLAGVALALLLAQVLWGDETGVFDLQPVELAKLALTALTAHCLALRLGWRAGPLPLPSLGARWLRLTAPALLFLALLGMALVQVDDYSPLVLLLVWSGAMALAYALASGNRTLALALLVLALAAVGMLGWLRLAGAGQGGVLPAAGAFYGDRFLVWLDPARHPHTGRQLLLGARAVADGGWWGADQWLGARSLGQPAGAVLHIPAVQDDFAPSFWLNRHGLGGGLLLWAAQAAFITGLLLTAARCHANGAGAGHFGQAWSARLRYFALCGGAAFVLGHLLLSWGTNLAIFPIMGQPMSFLSAGGSHLLFFLCPLLTLAAVSAQS